jgi:rhamnulokinase
VASNCGQPVVVAPATHDTGSAVAAIPMAVNVAFISSGTWSLLGTETPSPVITPTARRFNFTNEGGVAGTNRLLKNISGLWLVQCCRRHWKAEGQDYDYSELTAAASNSAPLRSLIDPDHPEFLADDRMPVKIAAFCRSTDQPVPDSPGAYVRAALESLALKYRFVLEALEETTGTHFDIIRIVGGGARNALLNQFTADATQRRVEAGPIEATALGNIAMQMVATHRSEDIHTARRLMEDSSPAIVYQPGDGHPWNEAWKRFRQYCSTTLPVRT